MHSKKTPKQIYVIVALTSLTITRVQTLLFFPSLRMNGGNNPDAWFAPWLSDSILGLLVPVVIYFLLKGNGTRIWAILILYSSLGAFEYATGIATQWIHPMSSDTASPILVYSSLLFTFTVQCVATLLLFKQQVMNQFFHSK